MTGQILRYGLVIIVAGLLAAPSLIAGKSQSAEDMLKKIAPYQGWFGVVLLLWGVYELFYLIKYLDLFKFNMIWLVTVAAVAAAEIILGILLGYNLINEMVLSKNPAAAEKGRAMHAKLAAKQKFFGLFGVIVGIWTIIAGFILI